MVITVAIGLGQLRLGGSTAAPEHLELKKADLVGLGIALMLYERELSQRINQRWPRRNFVEFSSTSVTWWVRPAVASWMILNSSGVS